MTFKKGECLTGKRFTFEIGDTIGNGGNGSVYDAYKIYFKNQRPSGSRFQKECVVKILKQFKKDKMHKRFSRFKKEIEKVLECQEDIPHIMKILDYHIDEANEKGWYLMLKAEPFFEKCKTMTICQKLDCLLVIGETIEALHCKGNGYAHRDIKMDNLLYMDNNVYLSDFGLIWENLDDDHLTSINEIIGPRASRPPEFDADAEYIREALDYRMSDIYLFGKLVWSCLKGTRDSFFGQYYRNGYAYLNRKDFQVYTLEPIHELLEDSTQREMKQRISLSKCLDLLKEEKDILAHGAFVTEKAMKRRKTEDYKEIISRYNPKIVTYQETATIYNILQKLIDDCYIEMQYQSNMRTTKLQVSKIELLPYPLPNGAPNALLWKVQNDRRVKELLLIPEKLEITRPAKYRLYLKGITNIDESYNGYVPWISQNPFQEDFDSTEKAFVNYDISFDF